MISMKRLIVFLKETNDACNSVSFNQYKCDIYKHLVLIITIMAVISSAVYWFTDCQIVNGISINTIIPRLSPVIPLFIFVFIYYKTANYKVIMPIAYIVLHSVMWSTIWAITYLPDKSHAREGFIIMHLMFIAVGYMSSFQQSFIGHSWLLIDIIFSNKFNHYESYSLMISLCVICIVSIQCMLFLANNGLYDRYQTKLKLEWLSYHDQLTGLYNRNIFKDNQKFDNTALSEVSWILLFDIDYFKKVNDEYGHLEGDKVLKQISFVLIDAVSPYGGTVLRWGGEEFMIINSHASLETIFTLAEDVRARVESMDAICCPITISCGVALYESDFHSTTMKADKALYNAKMAGRNCVKLNR